MAFADFDLSEGRFEGGIRLHLAINRHVGAGFFGDMAGESNGSGDFFGGCRAGAAFGGKAQQGDARAVTENLPRQQSRLNGDAGELRHRGIRHHAGVGEKQDTIIAIGTIVKFDNRAG